MSEYVTPTYLLSHGRLSELVASLPFDESETVAMDTPYGAYSVTAARIGCTVLMYVENGALTVRALRSEAHAVMYMDEFRSITAVVDSLVQAVTGLSEAVDAALVTAEATAGDEAPADGFLIV